MASSDEAPKASSPNGIQHMPRKRASGPGFNPKDLVDPEEVAQPSVSSPEMQIIEIRERRYGPEVVKYGCYAGAVAVAYTYANGFLHLYQKNRQGWANTFKHRIFILSPIMAMYACGNGVIPMPFKRHIERALDRPALSTMDIYSMQDSMRKKAAAADAQS